MSSRKTCPACHERPVAISYHRNDKTYYRNRCDRCIRVGKQIKTPVAGWLRSGYKKKERCEKCNFKLKFPEQANVYHIDGDEGNCNWSNLRTVCANCQIELTHGNLPWKPATLPVDY